MSTGRKGRKKKGQSKKEKEVARSIRIEPELMKVIDEQFRRFEEKFGRPPGPDDPIFFDPSANEPRPILDEVVDQHLLEAMDRAGIHPALIYAYQKTGRLVDEKKRKNLTKAELKEWTDAVDEWYDTHEE